VKALYLNKVMAWLTESQQVGNVIRAATIAGLHVVAGEFAHLETLVAALASVVISVEDHAPNDEPLITLKKSVALTSAIHSASPFA